MNRAHYDSAESDIRMEKLANGTESYVFDPYNPLNKVIEKEDIEDLLKKYGIDTPVHNVNLYKRAFVHRSYLKQPQIENEQNNIVIMPKPDNCLPLYTKSNERLEFVGDGVLECITKYYLYRRFPKENEGFMTEKKIALVKNESIGKIALEMGLHKWYILSKHAESKQTRTNLKKLGCLFESFIGAMFLDFNKISVTDQDGWFENLFVTGPGFQMVQIFVESVFEKHVDWVQLIQNNSNYKNILQIIIQKEFKVTPHYVELPDSNPELGYHMGVYLCHGQAIHEVSLRNALPCSQFGSFQEIHEYLCSHGGKIFLFLGEGTHKIKKKAEQMACESAIRAMRDFPEQIAGAAAEAEENSRLIRV
jgi:dsRNA-specific ribonuclease